MDIAELTARFTAEPSGLLVFAGSGRYASADAVAKAISGTGRAVTAVAAGEVPPTGVSVIRADIKSIDSLWTLVEAATRGALVIAELDADSHPYRRLVDLVQAAEDWEGDFRRDFEAALYAVVQTGDEETVHLGRRLREANKEER